MGIRTPEAQLASKPDTRELKIAGQANVGLCHEAETTEQR